MNVGKDWIRPLVQIALQTCLDVPADSSGHHPKSDCIAGPVEKNLSNFRIPVRSAGYVQIIKVCRLCQSFAQECRLTLDNYSFL